MYHGGPMTYAQAKDFCKKDNATIPYIKNIYWYHTLTQYLEGQQEDWRYYDMVWVSDLDAPEDHCKVFVDGSVERVSCDFLLPTMCEMDEHVALQVDFLKSEFIYAIVAGLIGILLIFVVCCLWCTKSRQRKKERFERRNSIRLSKSSLAGSRSLASMTSNSFSDINYRRRMQVAMSPNGTTATSKTGTINSRNGTYKSATRTNGSYDSLADKMNTTVEESLRSSFDMYDPHSTLGSHLAPQIVSGSSFVDTHEVHYAPGGAQNQVNYVQTPVNYAHHPNVHTNATIHTGSAYNLAAASASHASNNDYTQPLSTDWNVNRASLASSQGPPGYPGSVTQANTTTPADSVLELKRGIKSEQNASPITTSTSDDGGSSRGSSSGDNSNREEDVNHEYQTMDRVTLESSTFRPPHGGSTRQLPKVPSTSIPGVPGYAQPFARPFDPPPSPPPSPPRSQQSHHHQRPLETNFDDPDTLSRSKSRSVGQILETNFDEPEPQPMANSHSRSMDGSNMNKLSVATSPLQLLETGL